MARTNLDMDALRTLVAAHRLGGFNKAADHVGRSQSAVSQQIHKLEERLGETLFEKQGRGLALTRAGETLLAYARRIIDLNDEALVAVRNGHLEGVVRLGWPADFAESWLPIALGQFKRAHPAVQMEAIVDRNRVLLERLDRGELDLVVSLDNAGRADAERLASLPFEWIGPAARELPWNDGEAVPLAVYEAPCFFRQRALDALDRAGTTWRIAFTSPSLSGLFAAVEAGLGVTLRTAIGLPAGVRVLAHEDRLPIVRTHTCDVCLHDGGRKLPTAASRLREIIAETSREEGGPTQAIS